ncbi:MAG: MFS transporter [Sphingomonadaceae bacterium]
MTETSAAAEWRRHWTLVLAATAGMSMSSLSTALFGVMLVPVAEDTGWSRTDISYGPALISFMVIFLATIYGATIDRFGSQRIAPVAVIGLGGATMLASQIGTEIWQWWAIWAAIGLFSAFAPTVWVSPVTRAFNAGRGLAMAIVLSGSGLASFLAPNIASALLQDHTWRETYLLLGAGWFAVVIVLVLLFLRAPKAVPAGADPQAAMQAPDAATLPGLTARQGFRSASFYKLLIATVIANFAGIAMMLNLVPILQESGLTPTSAAAAFSSLGIATIVGRLFGGGLLDRFSASTVAAGASILMSILPLTILLLGGSFAASVTGIFVYGLMGGAMMPAVAYLASRHFGQRAYGTLYATIMAAMSVAIGLGPVIANAVFDATQSYDMVLIGAIPMFVLGALLYLTLGAYPEFSKPDDANA